MIVTALDARATPAGVRVAIRAIPRASKNQIDGVRGGRLVVRVTAPPIDAAANQAVVAVLAKAFSRPVRSVRIVAGERSRNKTVEIEGVSVAELTRLVG